MRKFLLYFLLILALLGAADAGYLLVQTVSGKAVICPNVPVGRFNLNQCNIVLATPYAKFLGFPVALYSLAAYLLFAILVLEEFVYFSVLIGSGNQSLQWRTMKILMYLSGAGFLISLYFIYLQLFVIKALCFYCLLSAIIMTLIFALSIVYNAKYSAEILGT